MQNIFGGQKQSFGFMQQNNQNQNVNNVNLQQNQNNQQTNLNQQKTAAEKLNKLFFENQKRPEKDNGYQSANVKYESSLKEISPLFNPKMKDKMLTRANIPSHMFLMAHNLKSGLQRQIQSKTTNERDTFGKNEKFKEKVHFESNYFRKNMDMMNREVRQAFDFNALRTAPQGTSTAAFNSNLYWECEEFYMDFNFTESLNTKKNQRKKNEMNKMLLYDQIRANVNRSFDLGRDVDMSESYDNIEAVERNNPPRRQPGFFDTLFNRNNPNVPPQPQPVGIIYDQPEDERMTKKLIDIYLNRINLFFQSKVERNQSMIIFKGASFVEDKMQMENYIHALSQDFKDKRSKIYQLLTYQTREKENQNYYSARTLLRGSLKYYEDLKLKEINDSVSNNQNASENIMVNRSYQDKLKDYTNYAISAYADSLPAGQEIPDLEGMFVWAIIFYFFRTGKKFNLDSMIQELVPLENNKKYFYWLFHAPKDVGSLNGIKRELTAELKKRNPFQYTVLALLSKSKENISEDVIKSYEDYVWFNLSIVMPFEDSFSGLNNISEEESKLPKLSEFQDSLGKLLKARLASDSNLNSLKYVKLMLSSLLYGETLQFYATQVKGQQNQNCAVDASFLFFILAKLGLTENQRRYEEKLLTEGILVSSNHIRNLDRFKDLYSYLPISTHLEFIILLHRFTVSNCFETIGNIITQSEAFYVLHEDSSNFNKNLANRRMAYYFPPNEIRQILINIVKNFGSHKIRDIATYGELVHALEVKQMYPELIDLFMAESSQCLKQNVPSQFYNRSIHGNLPINPIPFNSLSKKYGDVLTKLNAIIGQSNQNDPIRAKQKELNDIIQMEIIYNYCLNNSEKGKEDEIMRIIDNLSVLKVNDPDDFITHYPYFSENLKNIFPDMCHMCWYFVDQNIKISNCRNGPLNEKKYLKDWMSRLFFLAQLLVDNSLTQIFRSAYQTIREECQFVFTA
ncbi:MAG: nuclear pore complex Nup93/Nic96 family protein [archaeon]|nr:nuclear pore complex Nup93/Nic96 family protein [archaeon]